MKKGTGQQWIEQLASERQFFQAKKVPSLELVLKILSLLSNPDESFDMRVVIGGTAGKGTTSRYVEQTLLKSNVSCALISSPHLQVVNERIRINGKLISTAKLESGLLKIKEISELHKLEPTFYEVLVLTGIYLAAEARVEILICEVGLGGELDAVNAVKGKRIAAVTFIGDDHLEMFAHDIHKLAEAKAGIFTKNSILNLSYEQKFRSIFDKISYSKVLYITGIYSKMNKKIARKICEQILGTKEIIMQTPKLPARWEKINENLVLDGAHSGPRFEYILPKIKKLKPKTAIFGMSKNHDLDTFKIILDPFERIIWTEFPNSYSAKELQSYFKMGEISQDVNSALKLVSNEKILVTGSLYLCGYAREIFYPSVQILEQGTEWPIKTD